MKHPRHPDQPHVARWSRPLRLPVYVDIDGTLTDRPGGRNGKPRKDIIRGLKHLIALGQEVVLWSASGAEYVKNFAATHEIRAIACLSKPGAIIDDNPEIRGAHATPRILPENFLKWIGKDG